MSKIEYTSCKFNNANRRTKDVVKEGWTKSSFKYKEIKSIVYRVKAKLLM